MVEDSKKITVRRIVDTGARIPYDVNKFIKRDKKHRLK